MTASNYITVSVPIPCGNDVTTYGNIITTVLNRGSYNNSQGSLCGSTLDTVNKRFNINQTGKYLFTLTLNNGDFIDIRAAQTSSSSSVSSYNLINGATITLKKIE